MVRGIMVAQATFVALLVTVVMTMATPVASQREVKQAALQSLGTQGGILNTGNGALQQETDPHTSDRLEPHYGDYSGFGPDYNGYWKSKAATEFTTPPLGAAAGPHQVQDNAPDTGMPHAIATRPLGSAKQPNNLALSHADSTIASLQAGSFGKLNQAIGAMQRLAASKNKKNAAVGKAAHATMKARVHTLVSEDKPDTPAAPADKPDTPVSPASNTAKMRSAIRKTVLADTSISNLQKAAQEFNDINFHDLDGDGGLLVTGVDEDGGNIIH